MKLLDIVAVEDQLGESPIWDGRVGKLFWIDILGERLGSLDVASRQWDTWPTRRRFGSIALTSDPQQLLAATSTGIELVGLRETSIVDLRSLAAPESHMAGNRFNDGKTDRQGRFWAGTMDDADTGQRTGFMYRLDPDGGIACPWGNIGIPNGMCFSPDGRIMYTADSMDSKIWVADYDPASGVPGPRRVLAVVPPPGVPDGSTVDTTGCVWNAEWGAGRVVRYRTDGSVEAVWEVPANNPTCLAFGGPELDLLFITTARVGDDSSAHGGSLLIYDAGVAGVAETPYPLLDSPEATRGPE